MDTLFANMGVAYLVARRALRIGSLEIGLEPTPLGAYQPSALDLLGQEMKSFFS